ncbi:hypothetical protein BC831DRAFT_489151, partial [Entophlyctis helioformis]
MQPARPGGRRSLYLQPSRAVVHNLALWTALVRGLVRALSLKPASARSCRLHGWRHFCDCASGRSAARSRTARAQQREPRHTTQPHSPCVTRVAQRGLCICSCAIPPAHRRTLIRPASGGVERVLCSHRGSDPRGGQTPPSRPARRPLRHCCPSRRCVHF